MTGYCGLDCGQCEAFIATRNNDDALRARVAGVWARLSGAPIRAEHINCTGCRSDGAKTYFCAQLCGVRKCAVGKSLGACADCPDHPCALLDHILSDARQARKILSESQDD